jgi:dTDP-4-dehydrorhamnose 3,5-epimerase
MRFTHLELAGAYVIDVEPHHDERGFFARTWCADELASKGLSTTVAQSSISVNDRKGTLRGMHYQEAPYDEIKLVRCTAGAIMDVIIDLRPASPTYAKWLAVELSAVNRRTLYVPSGFAHGFQTLNDDTEIFYQISTRYHEGASRGIRWNDPLFGISWPNSRTPIISQRDRSYPDFPSVDSSGPDLHETPWTR